MTPLIKFLVTGSRDWPEICTWLIREKLVKLDEDHVLIQGWQRGVDRMSFGIWTDLERDALAVPARWTKNGNSAGPRRNQRMLERYQPDYGLAFFTSVENSKGTKDMVKRLIRNMVPVKGWKLTGQGSLARLTDDDWKIIRRN